MEREEDAPNSKKTRTRSNFIAIGLANLSSSEGKFATVEFQQSLKIDKDALRSFRSKIAAHQKKKKRKTTNSEIEEE
jgi:Tfp pilus assembly protein PilF